MKKVIFAITKVGKNNRTKQSGIGYITDEDLIAALVSQSNKPYVKIFEDCLRYCNKVPGTVNEFKGNYEELIEADLTDDKGRITTREITVNYYIWYKIIEE